LGEARALAVSWYRAEEGWCSEQDAGQLRTRVVRGWEAAPARAQRELERARATQDTTELREVGLEAVRTADRDTLCAMAMHAAAVDGADVKMLSQAPAGEQPRQSWLTATAEAGLVETVRALV
jgi:hypothetical protein